MQGWDWVPEKRGWKPSKFLPPLLPPANSLPQLLFRLLCFLLSVLILLFLLLPPPLPLVLSPFLPSPLPKLFHDNGLTYHIRASARYSEHEPT